MDFFPRGLIRLAHRHPGTHGDYRPVIRFYRGTSHFSIMVHRRCLIIRYR